MTVTSVTSLPVSLKCIWVPDLLYSLAFNAVPSMPVIAFNQAGDSMSRVLSLLVTHRATYPSGTLCSHTWQPLVSLPSAVSFIFQGAQNLTTKSKRSDLLPTLPSLSLAQGDTKACLSSWPRWGHAKEEQKELKSGPTRYAARMCFMSQVFQTSSLKPPKWNL